MARKVNASEKITDNTDAPETIADNTEKAKAGRKAYASKSEAFTEVAGKTVSAILEKIASLEGMKSARYEYSVEQIEKMRAVIVDEINSVCAKLERALIDPKEKKDKDKSARFKF